MSPIIFCIIICLDEAAKKNLTGPVICHWCNNRHNIIKYGKYQRYNFKGNELVDIQRYLCKHDGCRRTFSILPYPFLRYTRSSLCMFREFLRLFEQSLNINQVAKELHMRWSVAARAIARARLVMSWIHQEAKLEPPWGPLPWLNPAMFWSHFIRMFAAKFYPKRYGYFPPTET